MLWCKKTIVMFLLIISITASSISVAATENMGNQTSPEAMTADLVFCRPLGILALMGGTVVFVVSSPFSAIGGNFEQAWDTLVVNPAEYTFKRPLGEFE